MVLKNIGYWYHLYNTALKSKYLNFCKYQVLFPDGGNIVVQG